MIQSFSWKSYLIHPTARFCFCRLIFLLSFPLSWLQWRVPARRDLMQILTSGILNDTVVYEKSGEPLSEASIWILSSTTSRKGGLFSYCTFFHTQSKEQISIWLLIKTKPKLDICWSKYLFNFSFLGIGMTFSHMDIGELINLRLPPSPSEALIEGALLVQCARGLPLITHSVLLWRTWVGSSLQSRLVS